MELAERNSIAFIYASSASVYGDGKQFAEARENENPINLYAFSKYLFDQLIRQKINESKRQIVGLRYFNVYGPNEAHKGHMASVAYHLHKQLEKGDEVKLFEGSDEYEAGEQRRDFIYVDKITSLFSGFVAIGALKKLNFISFF